MKISLIPQRRDSALELRRCGDLLTLNGEDFDLSAIPDKATLPRAAVDCAWLASDIARIDGVLQLALFLPHGPEAPAQTLFPAPLSLTVDGPVVLPPYQIEERQDVED